MLPLLIDVLKPTCELHFVAYGSWALRLLRIAIEQSIEFTMKPTPFLVV